MSEMLQYALKYAQKGFAVFPVKERGKVPIIKNWQNDASKDPNQINKWWNAYPNANIGIATGTKSNLIVIDIDQDEDKGKDGLASIKEWEQANGELPETAEVLTGRGGVHKYYRLCDARIKNAVNIIDSVDIRNEGGYVVAPPSIHENGRCYEWEAMHDIDEIEIARADSTVLNLCMHNFKQKSTFDYTAPIPEHKGLQKAITEEGGRTAYLVEWIGKHVKNGYSEELIKDMIRQENDLMCKPSLSETELQKEVFPAIKRFIKHDFPATAVREQLKQEESKEEDDGLPEIENFGDFYDKEIILAPELIEGMLRQGHKMSISGPSKAGKSWLAIELAFAVAEGMNFLGHKCKRGRVLYINMEIDKDSFKKRIQKVYEAYGMSVKSHQDNIDVWNLRGFSQPITMLAPHVIKHAKKRGYSLIIFDPLYKLMTGDENSNSDVAACLNVFDMIVQETGASSCILQHFAKGKAGDKDQIDRMSGAGSFARDPDSIVTLTELDVEGVTEERRAYRVECTAREFPPIKPVSVWFEYPLHKIDHSLDDYDLKKSQQSTSKKKTKDDDLMEAYNQCEKVNEYWVTVKALSEYSNSTASSIKKRLQRSNSWESKQVDGKTTLWKPKQ